MAPRGRTLTVVVLTGVAGAGKSTLGRLLADRLGWPFCEGDDLHPAANIAKMARGVPLTDEDRAPWLSAVRAWIDGQLDAGEPGVITCSALKRAYRDQLRRDGVVLAALDVPRAVLEARLASRCGHYLPPSLLDSQLADYEPAGGDEHVLAVPGALDPAAAVHWIAAQIGAEASSQETNPVNPLSPNASVAEPPSP